MKTFKPNFHTQVLTKLLILVISIFVISIAKGEELVSFKKDVLPLLTEPTGPNRHSCTGCHHPRGPSSYVIAELKSRNLIFEALFKNGSRDIIKPGAPAASILCLKLQRSDNAAVKGERMPYKGPEYLSEDKINLICTWIAQGALNN